MSATMFQELYEWIRSLSGEAMFLFALPFLIGALALLADGWRARRRTRIHASSVANPDRASPTVPLGR